MQEIDNEFLVNECLIFSGTRDEDGDYAYYVYNVKNIVRTQAKKRLVISTQDAKTSNSDIVLFDSVASVCADKTYINKAAWENLTNKTTKWTLRNNDSILIFKLGDVLPIYSQLMTDTDFRKLTKDYDIKRINSVQEIQGFEGDVVIRQIELGE